MPGDLSGEQLEQNEGHGTDQRGCGHGLDDGLSDTAVILRPVVEARDGLHTLGETDGDGEEDHVYLADDTGAGQRNLTSVDGLAAVEYQDVVHDHLYDHDSQLIQEGCHSKGKNPAAGEGSGTEFF